MSKFLASIAVLAVFGAVFAQEAQKSNAEIWNEGVEAYKSGEKARALEILRPIILEKDFGARAAEVSGAIEYDNARNPNSTNALEALENAAVYAQIALRAKPEDERLRRNLARAISPLAQLRETKRINELEKAAEGKDARALLKNVRNSTRQLMNESATYRTNSAPVRIALSDQLAAKAKKILDEATMTKIALNAVDTAKAGANEESFAEFLTRLDGAQNVLQEGEKNLEDIAPEAYGNIATAENEFHLLYKGIMPPREALYEDYVAQSNAWQDIEEINSRPWQNEAYDYTRIFRSRLEELFQEYEQMAEANTNAAPLTAETKEKISALAQNLENLQAELTGEILPPKQEEALGIIEEIMKLLPTPPPQSQQNNQQQNNPQPQEQDNSAQQNDEQNSEQDEDKGQEQGEDQMTAKELEEKESEEKTAKPKDEKSEEEKALDMLLKKTEERTEELNKKKDEYFKKRVLQDEKDW
ncbi:MAG: hypothetical protein IJQ34_00875 [Kiritimatiellae bacterium]|nr:hypothetical protein [Kiritimatiellia bacterium]